MGTADALAFTCKVVGERGISSETLAYFMILPLRIAGCFLCISGLALLLEFIWLRRARLSRSDEAPGTGHP
jgi:hypothetical protein